MSADAGGLVKRRLRQEPGAAGETLDRLITMLYTPVSLQDPSIDAALQKSDRDREGEEIK